MNRRFFTMPVTCGRTSATSDDVTRPGNSRVKVTDSVLSVTTVTAAGGGAGGVLLPQADTRKITTETINSWRMFWRLEKYQRRRGNVAHRRAKRDDTSAGDLRGIIPP